VQSGGRGQESLAVLLRTKRNPALCRSRADTVTIG
jgi:hypothetical protein